MAPDSNMQGLLDFEMFEHMMLNSDIDDIHKYYDDEGEIDPEEDYAGESDDEIDSIKASENQRMTAEGHPFDDAPSQNYSRLDDPGIQTVLQETRALHEDFSARARKILDQQPLSTQTVLAKQGVHILKKYGQHGSQARLSDAVMKFLDDGNTVQPSVMSDGRGSIASNKRKAEPYAEISQSKKRSTFEQLDLHADSDLCRNRLPSNGSNSTDSYIQPGPMTATAMSFDSLQLTNNEGDIARQERRSQSPIRAFSDRISDNLTRQTTTIYAHTARSPLTPSTTSSRSPSPLNSHTLNPKLYSTTHDPDSNTLLQYLPFTPIQMIITWPRSATSTPPPGYLDSLNRLVHLYNLKAQHLLSYLIRKYDPQQHSHTHHNHNQHHHRHRNTSPELPHALFRLGITQYFRTRFEDSLRPRGQDPLGLTPEVTRLLSEMYDSTNTSTSTNKNMNMNTDVDSQTPRLSQHTSSGARGLDILEKTLLARACNVSVETIEAFWTDMTRRRRGWVALRAWCAAVDGWVVRDAKREGRW